MAKFKDGQVQAGRGLGNAEGVAARNDGVTCVVGADAGRVHPVQAEEPKLLFQGDSAREAVFNGSVAGNEFSADLEASATTGQTSIPYATRRGATKPANTTCLSKPAAEHRRPAAVDPSGGRIARRMKSRRDGEEPVQNAEIGYLRGRGGGGGNQP
jgi:hypothetical protein